MTRRKKRSFTKARKTRKHCDFQRYQQLQKATRTACKHAYSEFINNIITILVPSQQPTQRNFAGSSTARNVTTTVFHLWRQILVWFTLIVLTKQTFLMNSSHQCSTRTRIPLSSKTKVLSITPRWHISLSTDGVKMLLNGLNIHKATGPDGVSPKLLKTLSDELAPVRTVLFQASINQSILP